MTDRYEEWRDFYAKRVSSWMSLEELRAECGKLTTADATSPEVLLIHAMHALEGCEQRNEALLRQALDALAYWLEHGETPGSHDIIQRTMGDPRKIGIAIDTVCDALSKSGDWARALRLADEAAESVICTEGEIRRPGVWRITREVLDADRSYLSDCLQHLAWRQMADVAEDHNTGDVIVTFRGEHPADSEATPALSTKQWRSD